MTAPPSLVELTQQDAVAVEQITTNNNNNNNKNNQVDVYVVIKNQPFNVSIMSLLFIYLPVNNMYNYSFAT